MARSWPLKPYAPNALDAVQDRWRNDGRIKALGALTYHGGIMRAKHLASVLGLAPRGLRQFLLRDDLIAIEMHEGPTGRGEPWYRLNLSALPPPPEVPPLRLTPPSRPLPGAPRLGNRGAVAPAGPGRHLPA